MKKIFTLLALLISFGLSSEITATNNQLVAKSTGCTSINGKGVATFVVTSPQAQVCDLSFLMMPGEYADGSFTSVTLKVNGVTLPNPITFSTYGWQAANTTGNAVSLNQGDNTVQFISGRDDVPMVREVKIFDIRVKYADSNVLTLKNVPLSQQSTRNVEIWDYYGTRPLYRNGMEIDTTYYNTFILPLHYSLREDEKKIISFYVPSNTATVDFNMYFFYEITDSLSVSATCNGNRYLFYETTIKDSGTYYLLLEAKNNNECGGVTITVDGITYRNTFVSNTSFDVIKEDSITQVTNKKLPYNIFTTNLKPSDEYHNADSYLYLKQVINDQGMQKVIAYNDDNDVPSDFNWGKNARIRTTLSDTCIYKVGVCSMYPYSYFTPDRCDIYHSFWSTVDTMAAPYCNILTYPDAVDDTLYYFHEFYPNLKIEDVIESDLSGEYNCYAWAAGLTKIEIWLSTTDFERELRWFDSLFFNDTVSNFSGNVARPPGSIRYIRCPAGDSEAVVDLWGNVDRDGNPISIGHASIRNTTNTPKHGYDWESKGFSSAPRFFHPRYSLYGGSYDTIVASYRIYEEDLSKSNKTPELLIYEALSDGSIVYESIKLTEEDMKLLERKNQTQSIYATERFESYYNQWIEYVKPYEKYYNFALFKDSIYYPQIKNYVMSNPEVEYKVYKKFADGDIPAVVLMKDIASIENSKANEVWNKIITAPMEEGVIRTTWSNVNLFIKTMLQDEELEILPQIGIIRSNEDDVEITAINGGVSITVGLDKISKYSINAVNVQTSQPIVLLSESSHQAGKEIYQYTLASGTYIIAVIIDGNINAQKVIVK